MTTPTPLLDRIRSAQREPLRTPSKPQPPQPVMSPFVQRARAGTLDAKEVGR